MYNVYDFIILKGNRNMGVLILAFAVSLIPFTLLYLFLRNKLNKDEEYKKLCDKSLGHGALCIFPVLLFSFISNVLLNLTGIKTANPLLYRALYDFIVLAFAEELAKYLAFRRVLKNTDYKYSWLDVTAFMTAVGIGFGSLESVVYAIGASVPVILIRGICLPHAGYGFVTGYFYGKSIKTGKPFYKVLGFVISWFLHGFYDFSLSDEFAAINENLFFVALLLALAEIVLVIRFVVIARKAKNDARYTEPLNNN